MKIYRYAQVENHTNLVHVQTNWHTTIEGAKTELLKSYPNRTEEQMEEDIEIQVVIID
jgi:hypothetical protein